MMSPFTTLIQHDVEVEARAIRKLKVHIQIGKEDIKLSQFEDDIILRVENPRN